MEKYSQTAILLGGIVIGACAVLAVGWLSDRPSEAPSVRKSPSAKATEEIRNGLEECIGNTPLIRIKCLSEATGCEILGKAEVYPRVTLFVLDLIGNSSWRGRLS